MPPPPPDRTFQGWRRGGAQCVPPFLDLYGLPNAGEGESNGECDGVDEDEDTYEDMRVRVRVMVMVTVRVRGWRTHARTHAP